MSRKEDRELREVRAVTEMLDEVLENWGILMHYRDDDEREPSERFAAQIGDDGAVEYDELYALFSDVALTLYYRGREAVVERVCTKVDDSYERAEADRLATAAEYVVVINGPTGKVSNHTFFTEADARDYLAKSKANGWSGRIIDPAWSE
jgi:hypothetical protein